MGVNCMDMNDKLLAALEGIKKELQQIRENMLNKDMFLDEDVVEDEFYHYIYDNPIAPASA